MSVSASHGGLGGIELHGEAGVWSRTVPSPLDSVWQALPAVYQRLGVPDAGIDTARMAFGNRAFRPTRIEGQRLSRYLDCGRGFTAVPRADEDEVTMSVVTRLTPALAGGTVMETAVAATAKPRAVSGNPVFCQPNARLAERVAELVAEALGAP